LETGVKGINDKTVPPFAAIRGQERSYVALPNFPELQYGILNKGVDSLAEKSRHVYMKNPSDALPRLVEARHLQKQAKAVKNSAITLM
jgi:hypothetical protein